LDFFGIPWEVIDPSELAGQNAGGKALKGEYCLLSLAPHFAALLQQSAPMNANFPLWLSNAAAVYVWGFDASDACTALLRVLVNDPRGTVERNEGPETRAVFITRDLPEFCGPLSGMEMRIRPSAESASFQFPSASRHQSVIRTSEGEMFLSAAHFGTRF